MSVAEHIQKSIRTVSDFPIEGINFKDITSILLDPKLTNLIIEEFVKRIKLLKIDAIVGVESRGFLFGFMLANKLNIPFIPIRKSGKLPLKTIKYSYDLEYGSAEVEVHADDIKPNWNVLIHDDLLATGGAALAAAELVKSSNANVVGFAFIISLDSLSGYQKILNYSKNIISLYNC